MGLSLFMQDHSPVRWTTRIFDDRHRRPRQGECLACTWPCLKGRRKRNGYTCPMCPAPFPHEQQQVLFYLFRRRLPAKQSVARCRRHGGGAFKSPQKRRVISGDAICQKIQEFRRVTMMTTALSSSLCGGARPRWPRFLAMLPCMSVAPHMSSELWFHLGRNMHVTRRARHFSTKMSIESG